MKIETDFYKYTNLMYIKVIKTNDCVQIYLNKILDCDNLFKIQQFIRVKFTDVDTNSYLEPKMYSHENYIVIEFPLSLIKKMYHV